MSEDGACATEEVKIPCEFCDDLFNVDELIVHQSGCNPYLFAGSSENSTGEGVTPGNRNVNNDSDADVLHNIDRFILSEMLQISANLRHDDQDHKDSRNSSQEQDCKSKNSRKSPGRRRLLQRPAEAVKFPCEFCEKMFDKDELIVHQSGCRADLFTGFSTNDIGKSVTPQNTKYVDNDSGKNVPDTHYISRGLFENFQRSANSRQDDQDRKPQKESVIFSRRLLDSDDEEELNDVRLERRNQKSSDDNAPNITKGRNMSSANISRAGAEPKNNIKDSQSGSSKRKESSEPGRKTQHKGSQATTNQTPGHKNKNSKITQTGIFKMEQKAVHDTYGIEKAGGGYVLKKLDKVGDEKISESAKKNDGKGESKNIPKEKQDEKMQQSGIKNDGNDFATRQYTSTKKESPEVQKPNSHVHNEKSSLYDDDSDSSDDNNPENETVEHFIWKALLKAESLRKSASKSEEVGI